MVKISEEKRNKIKSNILSTLFEHSPKALFTAEIARELARDEEFIKRILMDLKSKLLVVPVTKNSKGDPFSRRIKWRLATKVYDIYKSKQ